MSIFSENLKIIRQNSGLKQSEIADLVGVTASTWSNYEVGKSEPNIESLVKISSKFKVSIDSMLTIDLSVIAKNLIEGNLKDDSKKGKNYQIGNANGNPKGNLLNEPKAKYGSESEDPQALITTLEDLVKSKNEIILLLKNRNEELEAAFKEANAKLKGQGHA